MIWSRLRRKVDVTIETISPVRLPALGYERQPSERVLGAGGPLDRFDRDTLFFDVFRTERPDEIVCLGPSLEGVTPEGFSPNFIGEDLGAPISARWEPPRMHQQPVGRYVLSAPGLDRVQRLRIEAGGRQAIVAPGPPRSSLLAGHRVLTTLSKDNPLHWIEEWAAFHVARQGVTAVLLYDNGSTEYETGALGEMLSRIPGLRRAVVVPWPFPYGVGGTRERPTLDNFCQTGMLDHARRRFCPTAAGVLNLDIDELLPRKGKTIFARLHASDLAAIHFRGLWVERDGIRERAQALALRHRDCDQLWRQQLAAVASGARDRLCRTKWAAVPSRCGAGAEWGVHEVYAATGEARETQQAWRITDETIHYRHFRQINAGWKTDRWRSSEPFDAVCAPDKLLIRNMTRWISGRHRTEGASKRRRRGQGGAVRGAKKPR